MKKISCADLPGNDGTCNITITAETTDEAVQKMFAHAQKAHADKLASITPEQAKQMEGMMREFLDKQA